MTNAISTWIIYWLWLGAVVYLTAAAVGVKRDTEGHLGQSFGLLFAIIAAFLLPYVPALGFVNFAPVHPALSAIGVAMCAAGLGFLVAARQELGRNWSQTVSPRRIMS